jgi:PleD family two-component response regulator
VADVTPAGLMEDMRVSLTMGLTRIVAGEDFATTLRRADALLYAGKRGGRNRIVTDPAESTDRPA